MEKSRKMTETLSYGYPFESTQRELSNEYQYDRVQRIKKNLRIFVLWTKVASALDWLKVTAPPAPNAEAASEESILFYSFKCWGYFRQKHKDAKIFENHLIPVKSVFIG